MATNHAAVIRKQGNQACSYCHQPVYCARCHGADPVLPVTVPFLTGAVLPATAAQGVEYPLVAVAASG